MVRGTFSISLGLCYKIKHFILRVLCCLHFLLLCNHHKLSGLKQHLLPQFLWVRSWGWPGWVLCSDSHQAAGVDHCVLRWNSGSSCKLIPVISRIQFLAIVGLRSLIPCQLPAGSLSAPSGHLLSLFCSPSMFKPCCESLTLFPSWRRPSALGAHVIESDELSL